MKHIAKQPRKAASIMKNELSKKVSEMEKQADAATRLGENNARVQEVKKRLEELERLESIADMASEEYEKEPTSKEKEKAFDEAYKVEFYAFIAVRDLIVKVTNGKIDKYIADLLLRHNRSEILNRID